MHLMLLPALFKSNASITIDKALVQPGGKKVWRPTSAESRNGFILHVKHANDIKTQLEKRQEFMKSVGCSCQPLIVVCGSKLTSITHYQLSIDSIIYTVPGPLQAVDYLFKAFQSLHSWYPVEAEQVWLFLQRDVYGIVSQHDNIKSSSLTLAQALRNNLK
ncbi:uncharacterized protein LOC127749475 [Frankliniella occidentalis]|uniref:Uncharacterized protein LOC127749475 n=1 Tax=Frankliniella occidentalis TaxID=133901 RepID=A0A9C6WYP3_FRAOC|nr:uncharacterized protein LOC127749475 [Frankliniella occidentalis]